jgi:class 3 adenylate cyclase/tetratricopeptide (TPR) repeat protein
MFVDMVGSTALSERLDPERLRDLVAAYHEHVARVVHARGGTVAQYLGDGALVYFGYPSAHEDDADRAVLAGLDLLESLPAWNRGIRAEFGVGLQLRLGVHSGDVVVATLADPRAPLAVGKTVNVASRLCDAAGVDSLAISEFTRRLLGMELELEARGGLALRGVSRPVEAFRVLAGSRDAGPASARPPRAFFGRQAELATLVDCFEAARQGKARCVVLEGEAGIGKSRLLAAFRQRTRQVDPLWLEARCSHFYQATALRPVAQLVAQALEMAGVGDRSAVLAHVAKTLADRYETGLLLQLFGLELPPAYALPAFTRDRIRADTMRIASEVIQRAAARRPVVLVIEDLHWIDPSSLEVLDQLACVEDASLLIVAARRHDAPSPWPLPERALLLELEGLAEDPLDALIRFHAGDRELTDQVRARIRDKADGVPLFAEELTKMVAESGDAVGIPATLHDSLMARLDRLDRGKPVARIAAAIGRSFDADLVARVAGLPAEHAAQGLAELLAADLIERTDGAEVERYVFRHALIQDAAYRSLLRRDRVRVHARIAEVLAESGRVEAAPARAAHHHAEAGQLERAVELWTQAGQAALASSAAQEAILHYEQALARIDALDEAKRDASGLWGYEVVHGDPEGARSALVRLQEMARASERPRHLFQARYGEGVQAFYSGDFERARLSLEAAQAMVEAGTRTAGDVGSTDSAGNCALYLGWTEHFVGRCEQGYARQEAGVAAAEAAGHAFPSTEALTHLVNLRHDRLEAEGTVELCDRLLERSIEYGFDFWLGICHSVRGWAQAVLGGHDEGIREAREGLTIFERTGAYVPHVYRASCLVEALMEAGRHAEALAEIGRALSRSAGRYDRFWDAEILRLRGLCRLHEGAPAESAEQDWRTAIALAERQGARMLALRATTTCAEWLLGEGRGAEARAPLAERLGHVDGGAGLDDVRRARAVLASL